MQTRMTSLHSRSELAHVSASLLLGIDSILTAVLVGIGRKFAIMEGICFIAKVIRQFKIEIVTREGESKEQWRQRVMRARVSMTLGVDKVPIRLVRRQ